MAQRMKLWRGLLLLLEVTFTLAGELCESTDKHGMCKSSAGESLFVDGPKLQAQIDELATFSDTPAPTVTRVLFTPNDVQARKYAKPSIFLCSFFDLWMLD